MRERASILIVDDNEDLLDTLALILKRKGFAVDTAEDGLAALDKFKSHCFDLTLMDIVMPRMNGVEAFRHMREINPGARVILMTAYYEESQIDRAMEEGAYRAIQKPMDVAHLVDMIGEATMKPPILVVDDDPDFCRTMTRMLEMKGYRVYGTGSGAEAIRIAREVGCQLAFIDVRMPIMDGMETYQGLKEVNPELVPIMMTGYREEMRQLIGKSQVASATTCLYKPFNPSQVMQLVSQIDDE